jgi:hypothetical protein
MSLKRNISVNKYDNDKEIHESDFAEICPGFDIYPTIIEHKRRVIAIGDIHGDMNLAIDFLLAAKVIKEVSNPFTNKLNKDQTIKEYIYKLEISKNDVLKLNKSERNVGSDDVRKHEKNQFEMVYRYYKVGDEYYVKIVQEDNNPRVRISECSATKSCDFNRWFMWSGNDTYVVQVGDQIDRCRPFDNESGGCQNPATTLNDEDSDLEIMLFYDSLDRIAKKKCGGRVFSLLGNHEIMNVYGDIRYVSYKGVREYSPDPKDYAKGYEIRKDKFHRIISKKMACTRSTVLVIGDYLFVHGGIAHKLAYKYNLIDINSIIRKFLHGSLHNHKDLKSLLNSSKFSPLWYRRLAYIPPTPYDKPHAECKLIYEPILKKINETNNDYFKQFNSDEITNDPVIQIKGMVIGHTPQFTIYNQGITMACSDRIVRTDIGGSTAFDHFLTKGHDKSHPRYPQVAEILTDLETKESSVKILYKE